MSGETIVFVVFGVLLAGVIVKAFINGRAKNKQGNNVYDNVNDVPSTGQGAKSTMDQLKDAGDKRRG